MLIENQSMTLVADLSASGQPAHPVEPDGAEVKIDGELIGRTPVQRDAVASGDHIVEFKMKGFFDHKETMKIEGGREKVFSVDLKALPSGPTPEQVQRRKQGMSSFGAKVNPVGGVTADFGLGYPYYVTVRLTVGAVAKPGIDVGVEFQTFFDIANLALFGSCSWSRRGRSRSRARRPRRRHRRRTAATPTSSTPAPWPAWRSATSPPSTARCATRPGRTSSARRRRSSATASTQTRSARRLRRPRRCCSATWIRTRNRFSGQRLYFGIGFTAAIDRFTSFFFQIEGLPFADQLSYKPRLAFMGTYNGALIAKNDHFVYGMAGITLKF